MLFLSGCMDSRDIGKVSKNLPDCWKKSPSQSSTFLHVPEKQVFHFLINKMGISINQINPQIK